MKKILFSICLLFSALACFSQSTNNDKPITLGIKAGFNLSSLQYSVPNSSASISSSSIAAFNAGVFVDFSFSPNFSIQPALFYTGKGSKDNSHVSSSDLNLASSSKTTINYLQIPVNFIYKAPSKGGNFYIGGGPFAAYGVSGKANGSINLIYNGEESHSDFDNNIKFGNNADSEIKRFDYGLTALAGYKFNNGFLININYDFGLVNIASNTANDDNESSSKAKTRVLGLSVGYAFK